MDRTKDNNYEQGYDTGFCQQDINSELKPGKSDTLDPFTIPRRPKLDHSGRDRRRTSGTPRTSYMKPRYILPIALAALFMAGYVSDPVDELEPEVRLAIKLSTKHLPIHRYFANDNDSDDLTVHQQDANVRRDTSIKPHTDTAFKEDDYVISDEIALRLMLARIKALNKYHDIYEVDKV